MDDKIIDFKDSYFIRGLDGFSGKKKIKLGVSFEIKENESLAYFELILFIGIDKMYRIKDFKRFIDALINFRNLSFGKYFILQPERMYFDLTDKKIIDFLINFKFRNDMNKIEIFNKSSESIFLYDNFSKEFIDIIFEGDIPYLEQKTNYKFTDKLDFNIKIEKKSINYLLKIDYSKYGKFIPIDRDFEYIYFKKNKIVGKTHEKNRTLMKNIFKSQSDRNKIIFKLTESDLRIFKKDFYDKFSKNNYIKLDNKLKEKIEKFNIITRVYFDMAKSAVVSKVEFCYGEKIINPCDDKGDYKDIRDFDREREVINEMKKYKMKISNKLFYLDDSEDIMYLLTDKLKGLKKIAKVYYSEDFKSMHVFDFSNLDLSLGLSEDESMLYMNINLENVTDDELIELLKSVKQRKRYFRLKNGSIINLSAVDSERLAEFINNLNIDLDSCSNGSFGIPLNRCMFIKDYLSKKGVKNFDLDENLKDLFDDMSLDSENQDLVIDNDLMKTLRPYQITGVKWFRSLSKYSFGGILADDMGLGKTIQVLAFIQSEKLANKPNLIIVPTSLLYNWEAEIKKFTPNLKSLVISGNKKKRDALIKIISDYDVVISSYGSVRNDIEEYEELKFLYVFLDEAQHIKNPKTINATNVKKLKAKACYALTGTPMENSLPELWSVFDFVMPGFLYDYSNFKKEFEEPVMSDKEMDKLDKLTKLINPFMLRRLKKDVLKELPEKIESNYMTELKDEQSKVYAAFYKRFKNELLSEDSKANSIEVLALLTRLRQVCSHPKSFLENYEGGSGKFDLALEIIESSISSGHSLVLFSQFTKVLKLIEKELRSKNINYYYLDGKISAKDRMEIVENFNCDIDSVFLISLKAGGTGLNLTKADIVIHFDPWWNPAVENQASDRVYRMGQKNSVQIYKLITKGTIEEKIVNLQERKKDLIESVIKPGENFINKMSREDIKSLFDIE